jgi:glycosyltransferase 2 family protein
LSVALVAWLVSGLDWTGVAATLRAADAGRVAAAFVALAPIPLLAAERWRQACAALKVVLARSFFVPATYAALFAGQFLPSGIGMDAVRLGLLWRQRVALAAGIQSLAIDRLCGVAGLLVLLYAGLPFAFERLPAGAGTPIAVASALLIAGCAAALFVDRWPLPPVLRRGGAGRALSLIAGARAAIGTPRAAMALALAVALHVLAILGVWLLAQAFGQDLRLRDLLTVTAASILVSMLPVSFNGWGVREGAMMLGLSLLDVPREVALMISLLFGIGSALWSLPGSLTWHRLARDQRDAP